MDMIHERGLKTFYSIKDCFEFGKYHPKAIESEDGELPYIRKKVEAVRDHPALLAWYLNDEAPLRHLDRLVTHLHWVEELDPEHPAWAVLCQIADIEGYFPASHAIGTDPLLPFPNIRRPWRATGPAARWPPCTARARSGWCRRYSIGRRIRKTTTKKRRCVNLR